MSQDLQKVGDPDRPVSVHVARARSAPQAEHHEKVADPHFAARENLLKVEDERVGTLTVPNVVPRLSETPGKVKHLGRALGADTAAVFQELLGIGEEELAALKAEGVI